MRVDTAIKVIQKNTNNDIFDIFDEKHTKLSNIISNIHSHERNCLSLIEHAIINVIKLDENKWEKVNNSYYYDFFQVRNSNKNLMFTYCLEKDDGIAYRGFCMKSSNSLDMNGLKDFLKNKNAISAFNKLIGYPNFIDDLTIAINNIKIKESNTNNLNKLLTIKFTKKEKELLPKLDKSQYNVRENQFYRADSGYCKSTYDNDSLETITFNYIVTSHSKYIIRNINKTYDKAFKMAQPYTNEIDKIKLILSKYIMLDTI